MRRRRRPRAAASRRPAHPGRVPLWLAPSPGSGLASLGSATLPRQRGSGPWAFSVPPPTSSRAQTTGPVRVPQSIPARRGQPQPASRPDLTSPSHVPCRHRRARQRLFLGCLIQSCGSGQQVLGEGEPAPRLRGADPQPVPQELRRVPVTVIHACSKGLVHGPGAAAEAPKVPASLPLDVSRRPVVQPVPVPRLTAAVACRRVRSTAAAAN
jgi:hypothetical protein